MRGDDERQAAVWSYIPLEQRVPADHPLRPMRAMVDAVLTERRFDLLKPIITQSVEWVAEERLAKCRPLQGKHPFARIEVGAEERDLFQRHAFNGSPEILQFDGLTVHFADDAEVPSAIRNGIADEVARR